MSSLTMKKKIQALTGRLVALNQFISRSSNKLCPFFMALKGSFSKEWKEECEKAFATIKMYLTIPPILSQPVSCKELFMYLAASSFSISAVLLKRQNGHQRPVYYIGKTLVENKTRYMSLEKLVLALVMATKKLHPYFQAHIVNVLTDKPIRSMSSLDK